jgi:hypothetical protein
MDTGREPIGNWALFSHLRYPISLYQYCSKLGLLVYPKNGTRTSVRKKPVFTYQVTRLSGNATDLYSGGARFEFRVGKYLC